jgi:hypothetical protein
MTEFSVRLSGTGRSEETVEADKFEIVDSGALVFYEVQEDANVLEYLATENKVKAFNEWREVERV